MEERLFSDEERKLKEVIAFLEKKYGSLVQLVIETPQTMTLPPKNPTLGSFILRKAKVTRLDALNSEYEHDLSLIVGDYPTFKELHQRVKEYNLLYEQMTPESNAWKVAELIEKSTGSVLIKSTIEENCTKHKLNRNTIEQLLQEQNINYFQHYILVRLSGVYHALGYGSTASQRESIKIANVEISRIDRITQDYPKSDGHQ